MFTQTKYARPRKRTVPLARPTLRLAQLVVSALLLAIAAAGPAHAQTAIDTGAPIEIYNGGEGQLQASFYGGISTASSDFYAPFDYYNNAHAGLNVAVYNDAETAADVYGFRGTAFRNVSGPLRTTEGGAGTTGDPFRWILTTVYETPACPADPCLRVTETVRYVNGERAFRVKYSVLNNGSLPQKFRVTAGGDTRTGGGEHGVALHETGPPHALGTMNQYEGQVVQIQEITPWTKYQEGEPFEIWRRVQRPVPRTAGDPLSGLQNSVDPEDKDKAVAVQWDTHKSFALAPGSSADYELYWRYKDWRALAWTSPPSQVPTHTQVGLTATGLEHDSLPNSPNFTNFATDKLHWRVRHPGDPTPAYAEAPPQTTTGKTDVTFTSPTSGTSTVEAFVDSNHNGEQDANEAYAYRYVNWFDRVRISSSNGWEYAGKDAASGLVRQANAVIETRTTANAAQGNVPYTWTVTGANPNSGSGTSATGNQPISWAVNNPGEDTLVVKADLNGNGTYTLPADAGEIRTRVFTWYARISAPQGATYFTSPTTTRNLNFRLYSATGSAVSNQLVKYKVVGSGGADDVTSTRTTDGSGYYTIPLIGPTVGRDLVTTWHDMDGDGLIDDGEPRADVPVEWVLNPDQRLTLSYAGDPWVLDNRPQDDEEIAGTDTTMNIHLVDPQGQAEPSTLRWEVVWGPNEGSAQEVEADSGGNASILLEDNSPSGGQDNIEVYADHNDNDQRDSNEPWAEGYVDWMPPVEVSAGPTDRVPSSTFAYVTLRDAQGERVSTGFNWSLAGGSANAPKSGSGTTSARASFGGGEGTITWDGVNPGLDTLVVTANTDGITGDETGQDTVDWDKQLELYRTWETRVPGQTAEIEPYLYFASNANRQYFYEITSNNGAGTLTGSVTASSSGTVSDITWSRSTAGTDTIVVWTETNGTPGEQAGDAHKTTTVRWLAPELTMKIQAGSNPDTNDASVGATATATATLVNPETGAAVPDIPIRWRRDGENSPVGGKNAVETDANGRVVFTWTGTDVGTDCMDVHADFDLDARRDYPDEPTLYRCIEFHPRVEATSTYASLRAGVQRTVTVTFRDDDYSPLDNETLHWRITGTNEASGTKTTNGSGQVSHTWTSAAEGQDVLEVWLDNGAVSGVPEAGEYKATSEVDWLPRLSLNKSSCFANPTAADTCETIDLADATSTSITATYWNSSGSVQSGTPLKYIVEGVNETTSPQSIQSGTAFTRSTTVAGEDLVTVWLDENNSGQPDPAEFQATHLITWENGIQVTPFDPPNQYHGGSRSQAFSVTLTDTVPKVCYQVTGANPQSGSITPAAVTNPQALFTLVGANAGGDYVFAWIENDGACVRDSGDPAEDASAAWMHWDDLMTLSNPIGTPTAGTPATVRATLRDVTTPTTFANGVALKYRVEGANAAGATAAGTTNVFGQVDIQIPGTAVGSSHLFVWQDIAGGTADVRDPGEPEADIFFSWAAPPVTLTLSQPVATRFEDNSHTVTATLAGVPGGNDGYVIHWSVAGANAGKSGTTSATVGGQATFTYTGSEAGDDTITAYAEVSGSGSAKDGYDPQDTETMHWDPLLAITGGGGSNATGLPQSVTVTLRDTSGNPLVDREVWYEITGANPTSGIQTQARTATLSRVATTGGRPAAARTNGSGQTTVTWTGYNPGTDTLDVYGDSDDNGSLGPSDARARTTVSWAGSPVAVPGSGTGGSGGGPTGSTSQVPPASDFDGLPTPPPPVTGRAVNIEPVSGRVLVRLPGSSRFIDLLDAEQVPLGTVVDVTRGRVELTSTKDLKGGVQSAVFYAGVFKIGQNRAAKPVTELSLFGGNFKGCGKPARGGAPHGSAAASKKRVVRRLWGSGKGQFRTKGRYAAAVLRGTDWETVDRCDGTLVRVKKGVVAVTDLVRKRTVVVRAGKQYFAAAKR